MPANEPRQGAVSLGTAPGQVNTAMLHCGKSGIWRPRSPPDSVQAMHILLLALTAAPAIAAAQSGFAFHDENALIEFSYAWPAAVESLPALRSAMRTRMAEDRARVTAQARQQQALARRGHYPFSRHSFDAAWTVEGRTPSLVSLSAAIATYEGGGHSENGYDVLLWDATQGRRIELRTLFGAAAAAALSARFCPAYVAARAQHLGEQAPDQVEADSEWACPSLAGRTATPADRDGNGRFDSYRAYINTGNFDVEGFTVDVPLQAADLSWIPLPYRSQFEVGR
jgi:hypothetical protein